MSDSTTQSTPSSTPEDSAPSAPKPAPPAYTPPASQADLDRIIADRLARERAKFSDYADLKVKAEQFDAAEEAAKSEQQKQADALAAANERIAEYEAREQAAKWTAEVASEQGLTHEQTLALRGTTKEEMEAHAAALKALTPVNPPTPQQSAPTIPGLPSQEIDWAGTTLDQQLAAAEEAKDEKLVSRLKAIQLAAMTVK